MKTFILACITVFAMGAAHAIEPVITWEGGIKYWIKGDTTAVLLHKSAGAIHRGFSSYDKKIYRNLPMWQIPIELRRRIPELPIICDPSHIGGRRDLIAPLCQQAMDLGFDGLIVESHCNPDSAWSDAKQQVTPDVLDYILSLFPWLIPGQGSRSHMPQRRSRILCAATKTWCSQINK